MKNHIVPGTKLEFKSKKQEKEDHGVGMKIIDYLVHKYNGEKNINIEKENSMVSINIRLVAREETLF